MLDFTSRIFALKSCEYIECSGNVWFGHGFDMLFYVGGYRIAGNGKVFFLTSE